MNFLRIRTLLIKNNIRCSKRGVEYLGKKTIIIMIILTTLINIFSFWRINQNAINKLLYDKDTLSFYFYTETSNEFMTDFLKKIKEFSKENNIEIAQYSFLSSNKVDIYSTVKENYNNTSEIENVVFNREIRIHDFEEILNVGFKNLLYIDAGSEEIIKKFSEELKNDCNVYYSESDFKGNKILFNIMFDYMNKDFLFVIAFFAFLFLLVLFFYYSKSREEFIIYRLWGYTQIQTYYMVNRFYYRPLCISTILDSAVVSALIYKFGFSKILFEVFFELILFNIMLLFGIFLLSMLLFFFCFGTVNNDRKKRTSKVIVISYGLRVFFLLLSIVFSRDFLNQKKELDKNLESLVGWNDTKNLFNLQEIYSPFNYDNLASEDILNNKIFRVYEDLSEEDKVFIMKTDNFERSINAAKNEYVYNYLLDADNEEDFYSPQGKNIVVDKNYIKRHTIKLAGTGKVIDKIDDSLDVLNLLVPEKYRIHEKIIENSFKKWFYFQKVEVTNLYREASNEDKIEKNLNDLKINIIYIKNNQRYFTYNQYSGNSENMIEDPIITVYTENIDYSYLGACLGSSMFMEAENEYSALEEISSITQKYNVNELNSIASVYDKKGEEIKNLENEKNKLILNMIIVISLLIMGMVIITYFYYKMFFSEIIIKSLHGYQFIEIYKKLLAVNLLINLSIIPVIVIPYRKQLLFAIIVMILISGIDYVIAKVFNGYLLEKGETQILKGDSR